MKRLVFYVDFNDSFELSELIKKISLIPCKMNVDFQKSTIVAEEVYEQTIDSIVNIVYETSNITGLDIENI